MGVFTLNDEEKKRVKKMFWRYYGSGATEPQGEIPEPEVPLVDTARVDYSIIIE